MRRVWCKAGSCRVRLLARGPRGRVAQQQRYGFVGQEFEHEAKLLASLDHGSIVKCFGMTNVEGKPAIVTELAEGSLSAIIHEHRLAYGPADALCWARKIADAMIYLADHSICHLDLKSGNVLMFAADEGASLVPKVGDFGLARSLKDSSISATDEGTVKYMAPEMIQPGMRVSHKTEVYSFALVLLEILTRRLPFEGLNLGATVLSIARGHRPEIPTTLHPSVVDLIKRAWHQERDERPSMREVAAELAAFEPSHFAGLVTV
eukprot:m.38474 g.38474  ORF g.38474 m.38474 type:complete len:263 (-) comp11187_c0_seq1:79-867(-)